MPKRIMTSHLTHELGDHEIHYNKNMGLSCGISYDSEVLLVPRGKSGGHIKALRNDMNHATLYLQSLMILTLVALCKLSQCFNQWSMYMLFKKMHMFLSQL